MKKELRFIPTPIGLAALMISVIVLATSCSETVQIYLRHDGTYAVKHDSFKERW